MYKFALLAIAACLFAEYAVAQEAVTPLSQQQLKETVIAVFDSLGKSPDTKYDVVVVTITRHTQTKRTEVDSASVKISNSGIVATEVVTGQTVKQTMTLRSGTIGGRTLNSLDEGNPTITPISERRSIGSYTMTPSAKKQ